MMYRLPWLLMAVAGLSMQALAEDAVLPDTAWRVMRAQFTTSIDNR